MSTALAVGTEVVASCSTHHAGIYDRDGAGPLLGMSRRAFPFEAGSNLKNERTVLLK